MYVEGGGLSTNRAKLVQKPKRRIKTTEKGWQTRVYYLSNPLAGQLVFSLLFIAFATFHHQP
ncbi:MAG TPA: hypothetical protein VK364_06895, partial [Hymenobacter sp.]|nr:hypothetical protein [Hymenobacter sp.]